MDKDVDFDELGENFDVGGRIKNAVLGAAYQARQAGSEVISMVHLASAAIDELKAAGKMVRDF